jgi:hypothetical protein
MDGTVRLPRWFRVAVGSLAAALLIPWWLLRSEGLGHALGRSAVDRWVEQAAPWIGPPRALGLPREAPKGRYFVNGMLVQYATYAAPRGAATMMARFRKGFERAGYEQRELAVGGRRTLVAIHPVTKVMLTVRPERDRTGREMLRLTQQNLGELDRGYRPELPGIPVVPGARGSVLVSATREPRNGTLTYAIDGSPQAAARFYLEEMRRRGWESLEAPAGLAGNGLLFFRRGGKECSVMTIPRPSGTGSVVFITLAEARGGGV